MNGSIFGDLSQPIIYSFVIDKLTGCKVFSEAETMQFKNINKSVLNSITFCLEDDNNGEVDFNRETLTFTLQ